MTTNVENTSVENFQIYLMDYDEEVGYCPFGRANPFRGTLDQAKREADRIFNSARVTSCGVYIYVNRNGVEEKVGGYFL